MINLWAVNYDQFVTWMFRFALPSLWYYTNSSHKFINFSLLCDVWVTVVYTRHKVSFNNCIGIHWKSLIRISNIESNVYTSYHTELRLCSLFSHFQAHYIHSQKDYEKLISNWFRYWILYYSFLLFNVTNLYIQRMVPNFQNL